MSTPFEPFGTGLEQGPPPPVSMAQAAAGHVAQATRRRNRRVSEQEMEAFESIFENVKGGSLELFSRLSPQGRNYFIQLAEPHLLAKGDQASVEALYSLDYHTTPVDPITFMDSTDYMGHAGKDVFPAWRPYFERINRQNAGVHEVIITGAMGIGKTMISMFTMAYKIYRVSLLKDPPAFYGLQARSKIVLGLYALTKTQIEDVGFYVLRDMLVDQSPYFCDVFRRSPHGKETMHWPQKGIHVITGSGQLHAIGHNLFSLVADELNYFARGEKTAERARSLVAEVSRRLESRFIGYGGDIPGIAMFLSQTRTSRDFLEQRIRDSKRKDGVLVIRGPRWAFNPKGYDHQEPMRGFQPGDPAFRVFTGDEVQDARLLDEVTWLADGTPHVRPVDPDNEPKSGVLTVPVLHYKAHLDDLHGALRAIDDVPTASFTPFFPRREVIDHSFDTELPYPFPAQAFPCHEKAATRLQDLFDYEAMTQVYMGRRRPQRHPNSPRYIHLDLSQTGDRTGIAMVHPSGHYQEEVRPDAALDPAGVGEGAVIKLVEVDFYIAIEAGPFKEPIDYGKIRVFVDWLRRCGFWIRKITADSHQSFDMMQRFREMGFDTDDKMSVDRSSKPYKTLRQTMNEGRMKIPFPARLNPLHTPAPRMTVEQIVEGHLDEWRLHQREQSLRKVMLFQELTGLEHDVSTDKVDHRDTNPDGSLGSKDVADAICGATWVCLTDKAQPSDTPEREPPARAEVAKRLSRYLEYVRRGRTTRAARLPENWEA